MGKTIPANIKDYNAIKDGGLIEWVGNAKPKNSLTKTAWKCLVCNHRWQQRLTNIKQGRGCPKCGRKSTADAKRIKPEMYEAVAAEKQLRWLGPVVTTSEKKTWWACEQQHSFFTSLWRIKTSPFNGCPICANERLAAAQRLDDRAYIDIGKTAGLEWLGPRIANTKGKTYFRCPEWHVFQTTYNALRQGSGCPECARIRTANDKRLPDNAYYRMADSKNLTWLEVKVDGAAKPTLWRCTQGHVFKCSLNNLQKPSRGCPYCKGYVNGAPVSKPQMALCDILEGRLNHPVGSYNIDIALEIDGVLVGVEYDGWFHHSNLTDHDKKRDTYLIRHGWRVLRVKSNTKLPTRQQLDEAIARLLSGDTYTEIVLDDWGKGSTFKEPG